jgi:hypothetical protein
MNGYQIIVGLFAAIAIVISAGAIFVVIRSPAFTLKPLWVIGCLFGFIGLAINWTTPNDVVMQFGVSIPVLMIFQVLATDR